MPNRINEINSKPTQAPVAKSSSRWTWKKNGIILPIILAAIVALSFFYSVSSSFSIGPRSSELVPPMHPPNLPDFNIGIPPRECALLSSSILPPVDTLFASFQYDDCWISEAVLENPDFDAVLTKMRTDTQSMMQNATNPRGFSNVFLDCKEFSTIQNSMRC